jgi:predicted CoA-substrate-specific enzyme activase
MSYGLEERRDLWGRGVRATGPYPHTPSPNSLQVFPARAAGSFKPPAALAGVRGLGGGSGKRGGTSGPSPSPHATITALGLDFGSRYVKLVYGQEKGGWGRKKLDSLTFFRDYLHRQGERLDIDWPRLGLAPPQALVVTGYGKNLLKEHFPTITEIRAHFLGARQLTGLDHFILLEVGGQDSKVLYVKDGRVFDFLTNDRCAAGTGRYLENMARFLKMPLTEFAGAWEEPVDISHTCAIFGESELIGHLLEGVAPARIAAGVNASVARRALLMVRRYPCPTLVFVGGVARNRAVVRLLKANQDYRVVVPAFPQFNGALGCCLEALKLLLKEAP